MSLRKGVELILSKIDERIKENNDPFESSDLTWVKGMLEMALLSSEGEQKPDTSFIAPYPEQMQAIDDHLRTKYSLPSHERHLHSFDHSVDEFMKEGNKQESCDGVMVECRDGSMDATMVLIDKSMPINSHTIINNEVYTLRMCQKNPGQNEHTYRVLEFDSELTNKRIHG